MILDISLPTLLIWLACHLQGVTGSDDLRSPQEEQGGLLRFHLGQFKPLGIGPGHLTACREQDMPALPGHEIAH